MSMSPPVGRIVNNRAQIPKSAHEAETRLLAIVEEGRKNSKLAFLLDIKSVALCWDDQRALFLNVTIRESARGNGHYIDWFLRSQLQTARMFDIPLHLHLVDDEENSRLLQGPPDTLDKDAPPKLPTPIENGLRPPKKGRIK